MNLHAEILHWSPVVGEHNGRRVIGQLAFGFGVAASKRITSVTSIWTHTHAWCFQICNWLSPSFRAAKTLTCAQALGSPTSSLAGRQSSSGGGPRWVHSEAPCRWCQALQWRSGRFCWAHKCMGCRHCWDRDEVSKWSVSTKFQEILSVINDLIYMLELHGAFYYIHW